MSKRDDAFYPGGPFGLAADAVNKIFEVRNMSEPEGKWVVWRGSLGKWTKAHRTWQLWGSHITLMCRCQDRVPGHAREATKADAKCKPCLQVFKRETGRGYVE